jgi:hypothetical protein
MTALLYKECWAIAFLQKQGGTAAPPQKYEPNRNHASLTGDAPLRGFDEIDKIYHFR